VRCTNEFLSRDKGTGGDWIRGRGQKGALMRPVPENLMHLTRAEDSDGIL
jgi:hypothetical protein